MYYRIFNSRLTASHYVSKEQSLLGVIITFTNVNTYICEYKTERELDERGHEMRLECRHSLIIR